MDETYRGSRDKAAPPPSRAGTRSGGRVLAPAVYRRRRRAAALLGIGLLALIAGMVVGAGSGGSRPVPVVAPSTRYFARIRTLAGSGPSSFAATERAAENAAITHTMSYAPYVWIAGAEHREVALTFDDGPGPYTRKVLAVLEREHVPATFFEVGVSEPYFHASTTAIAARGYVIGDHTENHIPMSKLSRKQQQAQLLEQAAATARYGVPFPRMFRPPYGVWDSTTLALLRKYKMLMVLWSTDTDDYEMPGVPTIVRRALRGARPGAIILMHDAGGNRSETVAALPKIISGLRRRGYTLVTVPRLLLDNPAPAKQNGILIQAASGG
jgi:peptidoglycan/xylan/chitin deacetylase (PgdA/CDA1 family)